ncbi:MAG: LarC family nickel insertion protein [Desulfovibrio sp.]|nr:LarC family nickel insertion protein [Desulfovibrio sp.]
MAEQGKAGLAGDRVVTIRLYSGISGDMFLAGLLRLTGVEGESLDGQLGAVMPELVGRVRLVRKEVGHVGGWHVEVNLPSQHEHRSLSDVKDIILGSGLSEEGKRLSLLSFTLLAEAEGRVHGLDPKEVHFHEVGALDSILDTCLTCELYARLAPLRLVVSPLPLSDGSIECAHGVIPLPAPAVLELLEGLPVRPFPVAGETVTPTAVALLRALGAEFGPWPCMRIRRQALVYGNREFAGVPNGALFALGTSEEF